MHLKHIASIVDSLVKQHNSANPFKIANDLGIEVRYKEYTNTKGYFINIDNSKYIVLNSNLDDEQKFIVMAHELGHAVLHNQTAMFSEDSRLEKEANNFAYELLSYTDLVIYAGNKTTDKIIQEYSKSYDNK